MLHAVERLHLIRGQIQHREFVVVLKARKFRHSIVGEIKLLQFRQRLQTLQLRQTIGLGRDNTQLPQVFNSLA